MINVSTTTINHIQITHKAKVINGLQISDITQSNFFSIESYALKGDIPTQEYGN